MWMDEVTCEQLKEMVNGASVFVTKTNEMEVAGG